MGPAPATFAGGRPAAAACAASKRALLRSHARSPRSPAGGPHALPDAARRCSPRERSGRRAAPVLPGPWGRGGGESGKAPGAAKRHAHARHRARGRGSPRATPRVAAGHRSAWRPRRRRGGFPRNPSPPPPTPRAGPLSVRPRRRAGGRPVPGPRRRGRRRRTPVAGARSTCASGPSSSGPGSPFGAREAVPACVWEGGVLGTAPPGGAPAPLPSSLRPPGDGRPSGRRAHRRPMAQGDGHQSV